MSSHTEATAHQTGHTGECSGHHHAIDVQETSGTRLLITLVLNLIIPIVQISYIAFRIGKKGATARQTFGYRRAEIMAALLNVTILAGACIFILYGALQRFLSPEIVSGHIVIWAALVGIIGNGFSAWLLHQEAKHNLNIKGAFLHMLGDFLTSVAVLISGLVMIFKPWYWLDPLLSIFIAVFILKNCWTILKSSTAILMNATPDNIDLNDVRSHLLEMEEIKNVHYMHAWPLGSSGVSFSCHIVVADQPVSETQPLSERIQHTLFHQYGIDHPVLQFETESCGNTVGDNGVLGPQPGRFKQAGEFFMAFQDTLFFKQSIK
ncbi:MAG: cation diffusion facilitator family transporter [Desulfobacteraceae bacterium]|nr:cation diffusion facilitator family transporter [Desulfobacteraceae bacterium]